MDEMDQNEDYDEAPSRSSQVGWAILLIGLGVYFLLDQFGIIGELPGEAWAFFLLIPIGWLGYQAFRTYQEDTYWSERVRNNIFGLVMLTLLFVIAVVPFLTWGNGWPLLLIVFGVMALIPAGERPKPQV